MFYTIEQAKQYGRESRLRRVRRARFWRTLPKAVFVLVFAVCCLLYAFDLLPAASPRRQPIQLAGLLGSTAPVANNPGRAQKPTAPKVLLRLSGLRFHDADTFTADIHLPYGILWGDRDIRVRGYDAWETTRNRRTVGEITDDELAKGRRASDYAWQVLSGADAVYIQADEQPRWTYERLLGEVFFDPPGSSSELVNYGDWMRSRNHARPTDPVLEAAAKAKRKAA